LHKYHLLDLYHGAARRRKTGYLTSALMRYWHLWEMLVFFRFGKLGLNANKLRDSRNKNRLKQLLSDIGSGRVPDRFKRSGTARDVKRLNRYQVEILLEEYFAGDTVDWKNWLKEEVNYNYEKEQSAKSRRQWLEIIRTRRNESVAGHGVEPVSEDLVGLTHALMTDAIKQFVDGDPDSYPLSVDKLAEAGSIMLSL